MSVVRKSAHGYAIVPRISCVVVYTLGGVRCLIDSALKYRRSATAHSSILLPQNRTDQANHHALRRPLSWHASLYCEPIVDHGVWRLVLPGAHVRSEVDEHRVRNLFSSSAGVMAALPLSRPSPEHGKPARRTSTYLFFDPDRC